MKKTKRVWNDHQVHIFKDAETGVGHSVVLARAGTGKTTTIVEALNYVPSHLDTLMVAFNKSIAKELSERAPKYVDVSTLHGYGYKACMATYGKLNLDTHRVMKMLEMKVGGEYESFQYRCGVEKLVSLAKASLADSIEALDFLVDQFGIDGWQSWKPALSENDKRSTFLTLALETLNECKEVKGQIDFDDMVWLPVVHKLRVKKYDRVFVDETQDLNPAQIELVMMAVKKGGRVTAVGDDKQAIYQFRGADHNAVGNVVTRLNAKVLPLSVTYRCAKSIVRLAQEFVPDYQYAETSPEGTVIRGLTPAQMLEQVKPGDFILSRTNAPLVPLVMTLLREGRKANIQGRDIGAQLLAFVKSSQMKSVEAFLIYLEEWKTREIARLCERNRDPQAVQDKAETLTVLCEGCVTLEDLKARIENLFRDVTDADRVILSTTHKAKGLERDRVFVLSATYMKRQAVEEQNLYYVAITRARSELFLVTEKGETIPRALADLPSLVAPTVASSVAPSPPTPKAPSRPRRGMGAMRRAAKG